MKKQNYYIIGVIILILILWNKIKTLTNHAITINTKGGNSSTDTVQVITPNDSIMQNIDLTGTIPDLLTPSYIAPVGHIGGVIHTNVSPVAAPLSSVDLSFPTLSPDGGITVIDWDNYSFKWGGYVCNEPTNLVHNATALFDHLIPIGKHDSGYSSRIYLYNISSDDYNFLCRYINLGDKLNNRNNNIFNYQIGISEQVYGNGVNNLLGIYYDALFKNLVLDFGTVIYDNELNENLGQPDQYYPTFYDATLNRNIVSYDGIYFIKYDKSDISKLQLKYITSVPLILKFN